MLSLAVAAPSGAQPAHPSAWLGVPLPRGLGDPHLPVVDVTGVAPPPASVPRDDPPAPELAGRRIREDLETIVGFSRSSRDAGDRSWGRVTGFPAAEATLRWVADRFREAGLHEVEIQEYAGDGEMWWPEGWKATLLADPELGAGTRDVVLASALPTGGSQIAGGRLEAPLALAGSIGDALPATDFHGKVAVQWLRPVGGAYSVRTPTRERARALVARGAVAVLNVVEQTGNMHVRDFSSCNGPCFNLGTDDGRFVRAVAERAAAAGAADRLRIRLELDAGMRRGLVGHNTIGVLPGRSSESVIVNAHADGWFDAAGDNGDGLAVLLALARHFAAVSSSPDRTLVFVASGGHHSTGLNGPAHLVTGRPELVEHAVLVVNLEHIAQLLVRSDSWTVAPTEQPMNFGISNEAPFLVALARRGIERYGFRLNPEFSANVPGDLGGYRSLGIPRVQAIHSGPMYHTSGDVAQTISVPGLERAARFWAYFVSACAGEPRADLDPGA